ncbi:MAG TPA: YkgJ family cysteine cluster protein [Acidimicrobiia bacterium]
MAEQQIAAGEFGTWAATMRRALQGDASADVPCDGCTACCTASQFVHVDPDETDALARIPREVLFPAPGLPAGHVLMGYDEHGACPMFVDGRCSIYEHRPRACRVYDCRIFAATGVDLAEDGKAEVAARVRTWRFTYATPNDELLERSMQRAAAFLGEHPECAGTNTSLNATNRGVIAFEIASLFAGNETPSVDDVRTALAARRASP